MNILLTDRCNRRCPYCFARPVLAEGDRGPRLISRQGFEEALGFARRSGERTVSLLGGEPSTHPEFPELVTLALERFARGRVKVFTNGLFPEAHLRALAHGLDPARRRRLAIIVNVNPPEISTSAERAAQVELFEALGDCCSLSCNLYEPDLELGHLVSLIKAHRLRPHIRLGLAQPSAAGEGEHLSVERYGELTPSILELASACDDQDISLGFDCGLTLCQFTAEEIGRLVLSGCQVQARCAPTIDVGPDLSVWPCFPLVGVSTPRQLAEFRSTAEIVQHFRSELFELYTSGALERCQRCRHFRRQQCAGGCAAHTARRLR